MGANLDNITKIKNDAINGAKDLTLTEEAHKAYVTAIKDFRKVIQDQIDSVNKLQGYGDPGKWESAIVQRGNLIDGCNEFKNYMGDYVKYLDAMTDTIDEVAKRLITNG